MPHCQACGNEVGEMASYCGKCGARLEMVAGRDKIQDWDMANFIANVCSERGHAMQMKFLGAKHCVHCGRQISGRKHD